MREDRNSVAIWLSPTDKFEERSWEGRPPVAFKKWMAIEYVRGSGSQSPGFVLAAGNVILCRGREVRSLFWKVAP